MIVEQLNFIVMKRNTLFSVFLVLFLIFSCEKDNEIISDPQYSIWEENKFEDYDFTLQISCFCIIEYTMPKRIEVRDNKVVSVEGTPFEDLNDISYRTIDGFFEYIEEKRKLNPIIEEIKYDSIYGFPTYIYFDISEMIADEEIGYTLTDFVPY